MAVSKVASRPRNSPASPASQSAVSRRPSLSAEALEGSLGYSLRRAQLSTYDEFNDAMAPFDLRPSQFSVLMLIHANPGLTQSAICTALGIQKTNFVALLDKLEGRGLTERRKTGNDRRSSALHLTRVGESFVRDIDAAHRAMEDQLTQRLGPARTRTLLKLLRDFTSAAG